MANLLLLTWPCGRGAVARCLRLLSARRRPKLIKSFECGSRRIRRGTRSRNCHAPPTNIPRPSCTTTIIIEREARRRAALRDFEQLKIENQTLNEKIEERNEELLKLHREDDHHRESTPPTPRPPPPPQ